MSEPDFIVHQTIDFNEIKPSHEFDEKIYQYFNPRIFSYKNNGCVYDEAELASLAESIKNYGLQECLIVNKTADGITIIDGHRRYAAISMLLKQNADCFVENTKTWKKASEVYGKIKVRVFKDLNANDAFLKAFTIDGNKVSFPDHVIIKFVNFCNEHNMKKELISKLCDKPVSYIRNIIKVLNAISEDEILLDNLFDGKISLTAVEKLISDYPEIEKRHEVLDKAWEYAESRSKRKIEEIEDSILASTVKANKAKQDKQEAISSGNFEEAADHDEKVREHLRNVSDRKDQRNRMSPSVIPSDLNKAEKSKNSGTEIIKTKGETESATVPEELPKSISLNKFLSNWHDQIHAVIKKGHLITDQDSSVPPIINHLLDDMMKIIVSRCEDISYEEFLSNWVPMFLESGLEIDAGIDHDSMSEPADEPSDNKKNTDDSMDSIEPVDDEIE